MSVAPGLLFGQEIDQSRGVDQRVDYAKLAQLAPWDDRNYLLRLEDVAFIADDSLRGETLVPLFYRVVLRKLAPRLSRRGVLYPRSALQKFKLIHRGFLQDGVYHTRLERRNGRIRVWRRHLGRGGPDNRDGQAVGDGPATAGKTTGTEARVTNPTGAAESAVAINPIFPDTVIAGTNGPGPGQRMHYSTDGGTTWTTTAPMPGPDNCCDPTVGWSFDGTKAYAASLAIGSGLIFYRSDDYGQTWNGLDSETPGDTTRSLGGFFTDKEYLHVDRYPGSPFRDNIYLSWHEFNELHFSRSTDFGNTWSTPLEFGSSTDVLGIGSDVTTDKNGHVYYFWPATNSKRILLSKSTDGGVSFGAISEVDSTVGAFTFPIPSTTLREVFIYVSADTDLSAGPYGGSVYAAWTDLVAPEQADPADNHTVIRVAYSRDGGANWDVNSPHELADTLTVDRWHQWLAVAPDGDVHIIYYDTRNSASRDSVDVYHSVSTDGAQSWSTPMRVSTETSPKINDSFEFGDYNGMDVVLNRLISVWTDNRDETAGMNESIDVYSESSDQPVGVRLSAKVFLEGAFESDSMRTDLNDAALLPTDQPYSESSFAGTSLFYEGTETGVSIDTAGVDWVRISLRTGIDSASTVATRAALVREDGTITEVDGSQTVSFPGAPQTNLYIVVAHRNHLPIMSSSTVDFSSGIAVYDFTTAMTQAYEEDRNPMIELAPGKFGMIGGDINTDGQITAGDFNLWLVATKAGATGYLLEDLTLDNNVTASDFNLFLVNTKTGGKTQVPD